MASMNSKKVNDKHTKKENENLAKDKTWKADGASDIVYKPNLKVEEEERKRM